MNVRSRLVAAACVLLVLACGSFARAAETAGTPAVQDSLLSRLGDLQNACRPYPWLVTGGQPSAKTLEALAKAGIRDVFDLRGTSEPRDFDEPAVVRSLNLHYLAIPVTPADFSDSKFTAFRHHLTAHGPDRPLFLHCASGNRVGAALLPWLVLDKGLSEDAALELARTVGLRSPELTRLALEYIRSHEEPAR